MAYHLTQHLPQVMAPCDRASIAEEKYVDYFFLRHGSNALDTFVLVLRKHCQVGLALFEPCLRKDTGASYRVNRREGMCFYLDKVDRLKVFSKTEVLLGESENCSMQCAVA